MYDVSNVLLDFVLIERPEVEKMLHLRVVFIIVDSNHLNLVNRIMYMLVLQIILLSISPCPYDVAEQSVPSLRQC